MLDNFYLATAARRICEHVEVHVNHRSLFTFMVELMIHGYHKHKTVWENPVLAEELHCTRVIGNPRDPTAVAIEKQISGEMVIIGHIFGWVVTLTECLYPPVTQFLILVAR